MILKVINHDFIYEMSHLCTVFFPFEKIKDDGEDNICLLYTSDAADD